MTLFYFFAAAFVAYCVAVEVLWRVRLRRIERMRIDTIPQSPGDVVRFQCCKAHGKRPLFVVSIERDTHLDEYGRSVRRAFVITSDHMGYFDIPDEL